MRHSSAALFCLFCAADAWRQTDFFEGEDEEPSAANRDGEVLEHGGEGDPPAYSGESSFVSVSEHAKANQTRSGNECQHSHRVQFYLSAMHSFVEVPTCRAMIFDQTSPIGTDPWDGCEPNTRCLAAEPDELAVAELHWNIDGCQDQMCVETVKVTKAGQKYMGNELIHPEEGIEMHPACAWGIFGLLNRVYKPPLRQPGISGPLSAIGGHVMNPANWAAAINALRTVRQDGGFALAKRAARMVDWDSYMTKACTGYTNEVKLQMEQEVLKQEQRDAVCWNNIHDYRDLWCRWSLIDVLNEKQCRTYFKAELAEISRMKAHSPRNPKGPLGSRRWLWHNRGK